MITKIAVENVKGFGSPAEELNIQLYPGKPNIVVAPNGFGKSSLSKAFDCLTADGITLEETDCHSNNKGLIPSLMVEHDNVQYTTDSTKNEVFAHFQSFCINSPLKATSVTRRICGSYNNTQNFLDIEEVVLVTRTPAEKSISYTPNDYKTTFGINGKILPNINSELCVITKMPYPALDAFEGSRKWAKIQDVVDSLNALHGSAKEIVRQVDDSLFAEVDIMPEYIEVKRRIEQCCPCQCKLDIFLRFWILFQLYKADKRSFKQAVARNLFNYQVQTINASLQALDTTWVDVRAVEDKRRLVIHFPKAGNISYGQRDSLFLFATLERIKTEIDSTKPVILIVDELFDYLDTVNMTIIQYYFSEFISYCKKKVDIYPIILTHLSPEYYHNYTFTNMNVQYLGFTQGVTDTPTKRLLHARGNRPNESLIYEDVSKYLLHYHTGTIKQEATFESLSLRKKWGTGHGFWEYLVEECNNYFANLPFDYYAISTAVRVRIEKLMYDMLTSDADKNEFLNGINGTKNKIQFAKNKGVEIPDVYGLLGIIYNDAEHLPANPDSDKPVIYRMNNPLIKHIIHTLFNEDTPITLDHLV